MTEDPPPDDLDPVTLAELRRLARSRPKSGRGQLAKLGAIRTLERLRRAGKPTTPMPEGWHPQPGTPWEELDRAYLDAHPEVRERWWRNLHP
jgi:hypothetical protein